MNNRNDKLFAALEFANLACWYFDSTTKQLIFSDSFKTQLVLTKNQYEYSLEQFSELILSEHRELWLKSIEKCVLDGTNFSCIISTKINNKEVYYFEVQGKGYFDEYKKVIGVTGICLDITEKTNLANELMAERNKTIQTAKMSTLGEMASGIAHELNNPLTVLSGFAFKINKMANSDQEISKPLLIEYSDNIKAMIKRMGTIINGLRVFARDGSNQPSANVQLSKIVNDSLFLCKAQFENKKIKFEVKVDDSIIVNCREILISQVLINLLNNAYQSLKNDEKLYDKFVKLSCLEDSKWVTIMIEDNGPGVPKEFQDKIFQAFFTTKKVGEGTGLGLSISKGIIESHQGELFLEQFEKLTRFVIKLPK